MKKVLSVSLGSSSRDHTTEAEFLGERFWISRQGTDADIVDLIERIPLKPQVHALNPA